MMMMRSAAVAVLVMAACDAPKPIVSRLDEFEANEIMVVLESKGISGQKTVEEGRVVAYTVSVPGSEFAEAMRYLVANQLPRRRATGLAEVYPAGGGGLIPTKSEEKAKFLMAIQGEIERKLSRFPGVVAAHVSVVMPDKDIIRDLSRAGPPSTASVTIVFNPQDERDTPPVTESEVKRLVAASVEDLKVEHVEVVMKKNQPARLASSAAAGDSSDIALTAQSVMGIRVADGAGASKVKGLLGLFGLVSLVALGVAVGGIVRSLQLRKQLSKAEADLSSVRKAGRSTQTGMQQPPG
jgi:type III secretion system YscJ/HrcJ family lipoprotein